MEILSSKQQPQFLAFLPAIKHMTEEWQLVTLRINTKPDDSFKAETAAALIHSLFEAKEGCILICNDQELLMVVREGKEANPTEMTKRIEKNLPRSRCEIQIEKPTAENLARFKIVINFDEAEKLSGFALKRHARTENIILIADDDMYMRTLFKKGIGPRYSVHEVIHGSEIVPAYKKYMPDILFLDIHMPGKSGLENLETILAFDIQAYVIMVSSDSSPENVLLATMRGAKGFLAKPFTKDKLLAILQKCPTII